MVRVLADYHHSDLFESYQLTLGDRFGWEVIRPVGMEWYDEGYWNFERIAHGDAVARQYLAIWDIDREYPDHWERDDATHPGRILVGVTLAQAREQEWDIVLCSLTHNEGGFAPLAAELGAVFGIQAGNVGQVDSIHWPPVRFALLSTTTGGIHIPVPHVVYRQEFDLNDFRYEWPPTEPDSIGSFIQCFPENHGFYDQFLALARTDPRLRLEGLWCLRQSPYRRVRVRQPAQHPGGRRGHAPDPHRVARQVVVRRLWPCHPQPRGGRPPGGRATAATTPTNWPDRSTWTG